MKNGPYSLLVLTLLLTACASEERMGRACLERCVGERQQCVQNRGPGCGERFERCSQQCDQHF